jgi:uncharacterized protein
MIVDLRPLRAERGATLIVACNEAVASQIPEIPFDEPVAGDLTLVNLGSVLRMTGHLGTNVELTCDRCARPFRQRLTANVQEEVDWRAAEEFIASDGVTLALDVGALAREVLVLALPMVARCDEACAGLCDRCGADLKGGPCACRERTVDPRLAPLSRLAGLQGTGQQ